VTLRPVTSDFAGLHGETIRQTLHTRRLSDSSSYIPPLTRRLNATSNARALLVQATILPSILPAIPRLRTPPPRRPSKYRDLFTSSPRPRSTSSYRQISPMWNIITITPAKNPTPPLVMGRRLPLPQHLLPDHRSLSVLPIRKPVPSTNPRSSLLTAPRRVTRPHTAFIPPPSFVTSTT